MDLNHRPPGPEPGALARLRYAPSDKLRHMRPAKAGLLDYHSSAAWATPAKFRHWFSLETEPVPEVSCVLTLANERPPRPLHSPAAEETSHGFSVIRASFVRKRKYRRKVDAFRRPVAVSVRQTRKRIVHRPAFRVARLCCLLECL